MKQVIPFSKEIVFKTTVASITSISLEHEEKVYDGEVSGDFIIFGDYKIHSDTTEKELFKYRLPFTAILPDNVIINTVKVDIEDFTYDQVEEDVIKVNVDFSISYEEEDVLEVPEVPEERNDENLECLDNEVVDETNKIDEETVKEIEEFLKEKESEKEEEMLEENVLEEDKKEEEVEEERGLLDLGKEEGEAMEETVALDVNTSHEEYVKYHIHIVKENETLEQIISLYETSIETIKMYNEVDKIKTGDKLIIPEYVDD